MDTHGVTTSFGRRPATLGQIASQIKMRRAAADAARPGSNAPEAVNKWRLFRTLTSIRERLGVSDRALSVLNALVSFHPETALTLPKPRETTREAEEGGSCELVVFPSNRQLAARAHGMAPATLWRHLTALVDAGLVIRRDSPNGKRYARRTDPGQSGEGSGERFSHAYGFDLTPLVARAAEFEAMADEVAAAARGRMLTKERISLLRRDVAKMIALGLDEGLAGDWEGFRRRAMALMTPLRRLRGDAELETLATALAALRTETAKALESHLDDAESKRNAHQGEAHQSNSNTERDLDLEPASEEAGGGEGRDARDTAADGASEAQAPETKALPLGLVMEACPDVADYAEGGRVRSWSGFLAAAGAVRPMLGISPDAWREAIAALGRAEAHIAVAAILQRSVHSSECRPGPDGALLVNGSPAIVSPGGYLRALAEKARADAFSVGPMLMALLGQRMKRKRGGEA